MKRLLIAIALILTGTIGVAAQTRATAGSSDEETKLMALNGLREAEPAVAVPQIEKVLASDASLNLKRRALGILEDIDSAAAHEVLVKIARGQSNPGLQADAIRHLGDSGGTDSMATLAEIYGTSASAEIKKSILRAFGNADDKSHVLDVAKNEKDPALRVEAVRQLGNMDAVNELLQLYGAETSTEMKGQILRALGNCDAADQLGQILQKEGSVDLRVAAVRALGNVDSGRASEILSAQYDKEKDASVRQAILRAFANQDNVKALIAVARKETDTELKKYAVRQLSNMDSKEATDYLMEILNK
ncbi:MAG TPA: HEAT repeat domain-containing protein [Candidatus Acidoferrum sp.]|nr:HEAT repeat domain-containing protein [Candidatus Acidoferrum sp.]